MDDDKKTKEKERESFLSKFFYPVLASTITFVLGGIVVGTFMFLLNNNNVGQAPASAPTFSETTEPEYMPVSAVEATPTPPVNEVQSETHDELAEPPEWHYFGEFRISNNAMELLNSVEGTSREIPIKDISGYEIGAEPITITLEEGQVLFISSGIYSIILPDGSPFSRGIDERAVANDYFFVQGDYLISDWERPTNADGNVFSAIGISVFPSRVPLTRMLQPVSDAFTFNVDEDLQRQIQDGRAKEINFSRFALLGEDGETFEIQAIRNNGFIQIELLS